MKERSRKVLTQRQLLEISALGAVLDFGRRQQIYYARQYSPGSPERREHLDALHKVTKDYKEWKREYGGIAQPVRMDIGVQSIDVRVKASVVSQQITE